jgi:glycosyltransferase involved in cell wall biosynthesis
MTTSLNDKNDLKRVCFVSSTLSSGGAERALSNLLCNMDRENLCISVLLLNGIVTYPVPADVNIIDLRKRSAIYLPVCFLLLVYNLIKLNPHILISVWSFPSLLTGLALKLTRIKTNWVVRVANNPADQEDDWRKKIFAWLYRHAQRYIVLCDDLEQNFIAYYPYSKGKTHMIRNGFDLASLQQKAKVKLDDDFELNQDYMVSVGSLSVQKRYDLLLKAYASLDTKYQIPMVILGDGPLRNELKQLAIELNVANKIVFKGYVTNPYPFVVNAKLFVLNSDFEGLCNAAIEAQCLGVPAVITDCPTGNREIVEHATTGLLVPTRSPKVMAEGIKCILDLDEVAHQKMRLQATDIVGAKYRIENSAKNLNELILDLS